MRKSILSASFVALLSMNAMASSTVETPVSRTASPESYTPIVDPQGAVFSIPFVKAPYLGVDPSGFSGVHPVTSNYFYLSQLMKNDTDKYKPLMYIFMMRDLLQRLRMHLYPMVDSFFDR
ncbi:hypothetical protein [Bartonella sp. F02]|uniref:hypothetical protein n=1 Tax=Bartonella sp. F02 TaxID=2967262 RepID=UPI0022A9EA1A|nr:hypothetical protein [Bartonella sp. F02]MCZ2328255.1 hypothetical protein [Bartonella sp. F02]